MNVVQTDEKTDFIFDEEMKKRFRRLQNDYKWIITHKNQLRSEYPNKYIAVENEKVRFTGNTIEELISEITAHKEQTDNFAIEYVAEHPANFLF